MKRNAAKDTKPTKDEFVGLRMTDELKGKLSKDAQKRDMTLSKYICYLLNQHYIKH